METPAFILCFGLLALNLPTDTVAQTAWTTFNNVWTTSAQTPKCGGPLYRDWGSLTSPFYPSSYSPNTLCIWEITTPQYNYVSINIYIESLESNPTCIFDYVEISDGYRGSSVLGKICEPGMYSFYASSNVMTVVFRSDPSVQGRGFEAQYYSYFGGVQTTTSSTPTSTPTFSALFTNCGGYLTEDNGEITSPNHPQNYPANSLCFWEIVAPSNKAFQMQFYSFALESHPTCDFDYVKIYNESKELWKICGNETSSYYISYNYIRIEFRSDSSIEYSGFRASYNFA